MAKLNEGEFASNPWFQQGDIEEIKKLRKSWHKDLQPKCEKKNQSIREPEKRSKRGRVNGSQRGGLSKTKKPEKMIYHKRVARTP